MAKDLLLELGSEELPASFVGPALEELKGTILAKLKEANLAHGEAKTFGTPRRLAVVVKDVAEASPDVTREVTGPSAKAAFDAGGKPTKAAEKFAEGLKLTVAQLKRVSTPKGEYVAATIEEKGRRAQELLPEILGQAVHGIHFKKSMRWGDVEQAFARPLHWIVALLGEEVIPVVFGDVKSGRVTRGHRFLAPEPVTIARPADYEATLEKARVIPDVEKRRAALLAKLAEAAKRAGGTLREDPALVDQVVQLVELPSPVVGTFEEKHLDLPPEVLIQEMKSHQRYFSLVDAQGRLLPKFIAVSNTPVKDERLSLRGYERVLRARLADGRFFFDEDRKVPLEARVEKLGRVVWQGQLGSYAEKVERFRALAVWLAEKVGHAGLTPTIERASTLSKADLVTGMVAEFPELQGVMGREYARAGGEKDAVALAIFEHYLPRNAEDSLPTHHEGALIGIADRLDTLCGLFAIGKKPTSSADPFGLRRACLGILNVVLEKGYRFSLSAAVDRALALLTEKTQKAKRKPTDLPVRDEVLEFFRERLRNLFRDSARPDVVEAVLAAGFDDLVAAHKRLVALNALVGLPEFAPLAVAFKRVVNIVEKQGQGISEGAADTAKFQDPAEHALHGAYLKAKKAVETKVREDDYEGALAAIRAIKPDVDLFFDKVMVMAEDKALRENRIRFLTEIGRLFGQIADFSKIQAEL